MGRTALLGKAAEGGLGIRLKTLATSDCMFRDKSYRGLAAKGKLVYRHVLVRNC